jgi:hypothetical protein
VLCGSLTRSGTRRVPACRPRGRSRSP